MLTKGFWPQTVMDHPLSEEHFSAKRRSGGCLCPEFPLVASMKIQESNCNTNAIAQTRY